MLLPSLYVIEIATGRIKVGYSTVPWRRLATHRELAVAYGTRIGREWISPAGSGSHVLESKLIDFCTRQSQAQQFRREYFAGISMEVAVEEAARLCDDEETLRWLKRERRRLFDASRTAAAAAVRAARAVSVAPLPAIDL